MTQLVAAAMARPVAVPAMSLPTNSGAAPKTAPIMATLASIESTTAAIVTRLRPVLSEWRPPSSNAGTRPAT